MTWILVAGLPLLALAQDAPPAGGDKGGGDQGAGDKGAGNSADKVDVPWTKEKKVPKEVAKLTDPPFCKSKKGDPVYVDTTTNVRVTVHFEQTTKDNVVTTTWVITIEETGKPKITITYELEGNIGIRKEQEGKDPPSIKALKPGDMKDPPPAKKSSRPGLPRWLVRASYLDDAASPAATAGSGRAGRRATVVAQSPTGAGASSIGTAAGAGAQAWGAKINHTGGPPGATSVQFDANDAPTPDEVARTPTGMNSFGPLDALGPLISQGSSNLGLIMETIKKIRESGRTVRESVHVASDCAYQRVRPEDVDSCTETDTAGDQAGPATRASNVDWMNVASGLLAAAGPAGQARAGSGTAAPAQPTPGGATGGGVGSGQDVLVSLYKGASALFGLRGDREQATRQAEELVEGAAPRAIGSGQGCTLFESRGDPADLLRAAQAKNVGFCVKPEVNTCQSSAPRGQLVRAPAVTTPGVAALALPWPEQATDRGGP